MAADARRQLSEIARVLPRDCADVVLDVTPAATQPVNDALASVRIGGTVVLAGIKGGTRKTEIDTDLLIYREIRLQGVFTQGSEAYEQALELIARNQERLAPLHTHEFALSEVAEAIETLGGERAGEEAICISIHPEHTQ